MKTAMQELIERLYEGFFTEEEKKYYLELEKKQIKDAYDAGINFNKFWEEEQLYYKQNYKK
jgi:uncharacterized protein (DUF433 family)